MRRSLLLVALASASLAHSATLVGTGFESSEGYAVGSMVGANPAWSTLTANPNNPGHFLVADDRALGGSQSLEFNATKGFGTSLAWVGLDYDPSTNPDKIIEAEVSIYLTGDARGNSLFGISAIDVDTDELGALYVDGTDLGVETDFDSASAGSLRLNTWNRFRVRLDYSTGTMSGYLNDALVGSLAMPSLEAVANFSLVSVSTGYNSASFDDYSVRTAPVPEPASLAALGLGSLTLLRPRKTKQVKN